MNDNEKEYLERIITLEKQIEILQEDNIARKEAHRKLKVEIFSIKKHLSFVLWCTHSWKNFILFLIITGFYFSFVDVAVSTENIRFVIINRIIPFLLG